MASPLVRCLLVLVVPAALGAQTPDSAARDTTRHAAPLTSGARITKAHLDSLPIDDPASAFAQIPGVFLRGGDVGLAPNLSLSIRGGPGNQAATYVDGVPVRSQLTGNALVVPALNGIAGIDVTTGLAGAELSDAQFGVISYRTPAGGDRLQTHWSAHTDAPFGSGTSVGYNRFAGDLSGPVPGAPGLTFFLSGMAQGQGSEYLGAGAQNVPTYELGGLDTTVLVPNPGGGGTQSVAVPRFVQVSGSCDAGTNGAECRGLTRPMDWRTSVEMQGKLQWTYGTGSRVSVTGISLGNQSRAFPGTTLGDPALFSGAHEWIRLGIVNWHHSFGPTLALDAAFSLGTDDALGGALDPASETATRDPSLGIELSSLTFSTFNGLGVPLPDSIIKNIRTNSGLRIPLLGQTQLNDAQPYRLNPYAMASGGFYTEGIVAPLELASERRFTGRVQAEWLEGRHHVVVGYDADGSDLTSYYVASPVNQIFLNAWTAQPRRRGLFATDLVSIGFVTVDAGLRYDRINPGALLSVTPGFTFSDPNWDQTSGTNPAAYAASLARVFVPTRDQSFVSPRVRAVATIDPATSVRLAVGQTLISPPASDVASNSNSDLTFTNAGAFFGRDVPYAKATSIEGGGRRWFGAGTSIDLSGYYTFHIPDYSGQIEDFNDPTNPGRQLTISVLGRGYSTYEWGIDATAGHRWGDWLAVNVSYGLNVNGFEDVNPVILPVIPGAPPAINSPPGSETGHEIAASVSLAVPAGWATGSWKSALRNVAAVLQFRMISGLPYTPLVNAGDGEVAPAETLGLVASQAGGINSEHLPWTKYLDLRLTKGVTAKGLRWTVFADFRNLLNFQNLYALYAETGSTSNAVFMHNATAAEFVNLANEASSNGALNPDGSVSTANCAGWGGAAGPVDCVMIKRAEARFGNGDGVFTLPEQTAAFNAAFDLVYGSWRFYGPQRTARAGLELDF